MKTICSAETLSAAGIDHLPGMSATQIDAARRHLFLGDGRTLSYDRLLIATGAWPRRLTCAGAERALDFRTFTDADAIFLRVKVGGTVAIIGGGLIGMELAAVLRGKGVGVHVIEAAPKTLARAVPPRLAARLQARHREEGVHFHLGQGLAQIKPESVVLADGTVVPADVVVSAIGVVPDTEIAD